MLQTGVLRTSVFDYKCRAPVLWNPTWFYKRGLRMLLQHQSCSWKTATLQISESFHLWKSLISISNRTETPLQIFSMDFVNLLGTSFFGNTPESLLLNIWFKGNRKDKKWTSIECTYKERWCHLSTSLNFLTCNGKIQREKQTAEEAIHRCC